jgi:thiol-disulfide isomerase/thioredoxin
MLQTLQTDSFIVHELNDKKYLVIEHPGMSIVFFTGSNCQYCVQMRDVLDRTMPTFMNRLKFFTINLTENKEVVKKSEATFFISDGSSATIQHVPIVIFYDNSLPFKKFSGNYTVQEFSNFLDECLALKQPSIEYKSPVAPSRAAAHHYQQAPMTPQPMAQQTTYQPYQQNGYDQQYQQHQQQASMHPAASASMHQQYGSSSHPASASMHTQQPHGSQYSRSHQQQSAPVTASAEAITLNNCSTRKFCYLTYKDAYQGP